MTKAKPSSSSMVFHDLESYELYFNRELSWVQFNQRVLHEALDERTPLLERLKFMGIFSSNLDEFFMVRVAGLKTQVEAEVDKLSLDGSTPAEQLIQISDALRPLVTKQDHHFQYILRPALVQQNIHLVDYGDLSLEQRNFLHDYFEGKIFPVLTPLAVDLSHPFPYISNLSLNLAVILQDPETKEELFSRIKVPKVLPRFIEFPRELRQKDSIWMGIPIEQVIAHNLQSLFLGMDVKECHPFRLTRNADLAVEEDEADDLLIAIEQELVKRRFGGSAVRLEIQKSIPGHIRAMLIRELKLKEQDVYELEGLLGLECLMGFLSLNLPSLKDQPWSAIVPKRFKKLYELTNEDDDDLNIDEKDNIFGLIKEGDILVHHPYESFSATVQLFIARAAIDREVVAIKMTLYRTSGDSPIIQSLIKAAQNGKQVIALVELKARFDEENNINWARKLEKAGVHVVYGLVGLKTHTKIVLVVRQENAKLQRYVHIGTGNYNPKTAKLYTDLGLFSCQDDLGKDLTDLFNFLTGYSKQKDYRKLLVAPTTLRPRMIEMIERETSHAQGGGKGRIVAKINSLVDGEIIEALYRASRAGVKINLIVRGICCLKPGIPGLSENIEVISIIGRFLEHSRIFHFHNGGQEEVYIGSADWMKRNLSRRVEAVTPIEDPQLIKGLEEILGIMLADNRNAWELQSDGSYLQRKPLEGENENSAHSVLMAMATSVNKSV